MVSKKKRKNIASHVETFERKIIVQYVEICNRDIQFCKNKSEYRMFKTSGRKSLYTRPNKVIVYYVKNWEKGPSVVSINQ